jgi:hypothetical protein
MAGGGDGQNEKGPDFHPGLFAHFSCSFGKNEYCLLGEFLSGRLLVLQPVTFTAFAGEQYRQSGKMQFCSTVRTSLGPDLFMNTISRIIPLHFNPCSHFTPPLLQIEPSA